MWHKRRRQYIPRSSAFSDFDSYAVVSKQDIVARGPHHDLLVDIVSNILRDVREIVSNNWRLSFRLDTFLTPYICVYTQLLKRGAHGDQYFHRNDI